MKNSLATRLFISCFTFVLFFHYLCSKLHSSEIERYRANPAKALSYKIGQFKIGSLWRKAEEAMGDQFGIRVFHQKILESGAVPLSILENKINHWIYNPS